MIFSIDIFNEIIKYLKYSEQKSLRQSGKALKALPIPVGPNYDKENWPVRIVNVVKYIFSECTWWTRGYNSLDSKTIRFVHKNDPSLCVTLNVRKEQVYHVYKTTQFSHYRNGRPRDKTQIHNVHLREQQDVISLLQGYKLDLTFSDVERKIHCYTK